MCWIKKIEELIIFDISSIMSLFTKIDPIKLVQLQYLKVVFSDYLRLFNVFHLGHNN